MEDLSKRRAARRENDICQSAIHSTAARENPLAPPKARLIAPSTKEKFAIVRFTEDVRNHLTHNKK